MSILSDQEILAIAEGVSRSGAQKAAAVKAVTEALGRVPDATKGGTVPERTVVVDPVPSAPVVIFVCSARDVPESDRKGFWQRLDQALAMYGQVEIVTFGGLGSEVIAQKWAAARGMPHREFALVWAVPQVDGSTKRDGRAPATRERKLRALMSHLGPGQAWAILHGDPTSTQRDYKAARAVFQFLERIGANRPVPAEEPEPAPEPPEPVIAEPDGPEDDLAAVAAELGLDVQGDVERDEDGNPV